MKYLFTTITFQLESSSFSLENILDHFFSIQQNCSVFAAGRLGFVIAGVKNNLKYKYSYGYKYGSISIKEKGMNLLIFSNKKVKLSTAFPETFEFDDFINSQAEFYSSLCKCSYKNVQVHNITLQKETTKISIPCLKNKIQKFEYLFHRVVYPDMEIHSRFTYRCYLNSSNCHIAIDNSGTFQIFGATSENDVNLLKSKFDIIHSDIILDHLLSE